MNNTGRDNKFVTYAYVRAITPETLAEDEIIRTINNRLLYAASADFTELVVDFAEDAEAEKYGKMLQERGWTVAIEDNELNVWL